LRAIEFGVFPHIPGDGREYVVARGDAVKVRAEDRRRIERVDLSSLIGELPNGRSTTDFCTDEASGSTSQAAAILEALEAGSRLLLVDEDTAATNLMVRDARMQRLVNRESEPITPLLDRIREFYEREGVSAILVMGGCGDYFEVADTVIRMRDYRPEEVTREAKEIAKALPSRRGFGGAEPFRLPRGRVPDPRSINPLKGKGKVKIDAEGVDGIRFGGDTIDLRAVEQLADPSQLRAIGRALHKAAREMSEDRPDLAKLLDRLEQLMEEKTVDGLSGFGGEAHPGESGPAEALRNRRGPQSTAEPDDQFLTSSF
jgi:predicted ABC-class ATPase